MNNQIIVIIWFGGDKTRKNLLSIKVDEEFDAKNIESCFEVCNKMLNKVADTEYKMSNLYAADILLVYNLHARKPIALCYGMNGDVEKNY